MSVSKTPPIHVLRGILRLLKSPAEMSKTTSTRAYVLDQYRSNQSETSSEEKMKMRKLAFDYFKLQTGLAERQKLYDLDISAEDELTPKELTRRAAARAGLQPPKLNPDLQ